MEITLKDLDFLLGSVQDSKQSIFLDNLRTKIQEGNTETRHITPIYFFCSNCLWNSFLYLKLAKIYFHVVSTLAHSGL